MIIEPKLSKPARIGLLLILIFSLFLPRSARAAGILPQGVGPDTSVVTPPPADAKVRVLFFYSNTCSHCLAVIENIVKPLQDEHPGEVDFRLLELSQKVNYEALMAAETQLAVSPENRDLPVVILGDKVLIGEEENNQSLRQLVEAGLTGQGIPFYPFEGVSIDELITSTPNPSEEELEACSVDNPDNCTTDNPIYAAYFYQTGCKECARSEVDLEYLKGKYPQLIVQEYNIYDQAGLANWLAERVGRADDLHTPALFIGDNAWIGESEIRPQTIEPTLETLTEKGSPDFWTAYNPDEGAQTLMERFQKMGWVAVLLAGLVDGLNPCAFATIIFFVSYLTLSGKKGKQILLTGASFTVGVFVAYLIVGLGFYKVLDLVKVYMSVISKIVYVLTAIFCLVLAFMSIRDYFKTKEGDLNDMALKLPEPLRKRINAAVREGRKSSSYYLSAFVTGLIISILELACTGQIYLPVIISMSTMPELRGRATLFLVLYNLMFIVPLIIVFILAYYGTTSKQFTNFLKKHAAAVKIGMAIIFLILAIWLISSLLS
jgi:cytochrome c biogenesis protein CcdA